MLDRDLEIAVRDLFRRGKPQKAIRLVGPEQVKVLRDLGSEFLAEGNIEAGLLCRRKAVELQPTERVLRMEWVRSLLTVGRTEEARAVGGADTQLWRDLGGDFFRSGNADFGIMCRRIAAELAPDDTIVHLELLRALGSTGNKDPALAYAGTFQIVAPPATRHDFTPEEKVIYSRVMDIAIASPELVVALIRATDYVVRGRIPGAFMECGAYRGGSTMTVMYALLNRQSSDREFYLYDTFTGFPLPETVDVYHDGTPALEEWDQKKTADGTSGWLVSPIEHTRGNIESVGYPMSKVHIVKGMVEDTIPATAPEQIAFLRLDTDFYRSTKHELEHLYPRLSPGGVLIIDDYGAFSGAQKAVDEYFDSRGFRPLLHRVDAHVRMITKDR